MDKKVATTVTVSLLRYKELEACEQAVKERKSIVFYPNAYHQNPMVIRIGAKSKLLDELAERNNELQETINDLADRAAKLEEREKALSYQIQQEREFNNENFNSAVRKRAEELFDKRHPQNILTKTQMVVQMSKLKLSNTTLLIADCFNYGGAVNALQKSMQQVEFGAVKFLTDIAIKVDGVEVVQIPRINNKEEYSHFMIKELYKYFDTEYVLVVQHDGYVINAEAWTNEFFHYDYIGAPWLYVDGRNVGNGGCSLRSMRLQHTLGRVDAFFITHPEDEIIGRLYRKALEYHHDIKFAPEELADRFAFELREPNQPTFGFHGYFHQPYKPHVVLKRSGALGDCVLIEPVVRWYCENGWIPVLDIPASFFDLYKGYPFRVKHISQLDAGRITPEKEINLDMAYEVFQDRNYVQAYFEMSGITEYKLTRPHLWPKVNDQTKLFINYAVVHIDERNEPERNTLFQQWEVIESYLNGKGMQVIQIGYGRHYKAGLWINTPTVEMMKYVIGGASLFIGCDSGPSNIAVAQGVPSVLLFGSVDPEKIHVDMSKVEVVQGDCDKKGCWHVQGGTAGMACKYANTDNYLQCCRHSKNDIVNAIENVLNKSYASSQI